MFLRRFDPNAIDPLFLVNRQADLDWLFGTLEAYLTDPDPTARRRLAFCVVGEKGVGKTILTRAALRKARERYSDRALFIEVDCRSYLSARQVIDAIAKETVEALYGMKMREALSRTRGIERVSDELLATAQILAAITRFDDAELKEIHQHIEHLKVAASLKGERALLKALNVSFQISIERSISHSKELSGKVRFDEPRLIQALVALFKDIRANGLDVVLYLDNMDELRHHYRTDEERQKVRRDTEALLALRGAPIILVLNMRTYYSGILPREIANRRVLRRLPQNELLTILQERVNAESPAVKQRLEDPIVKEAIRRLAAIAPTPLAFLTWFKALFDQDALSGAGLGDGIKGFLETYYSTAPEETWRKVAEAFDDPEGCIAREAVLAACGRNEALFNQVVDRQGVLPKDFWDPTTYFTLDPELFLLHPKRSPVAAGSAAPAES